MKIIKKYLTDRSDITKILSNMGWLFSDRVLRLVVTLFVSAWVARYLGVKQYGQLNLALAYIALVLPIARLGLDQIVVKKLVEIPDEADKILGTAFWMQLLASIALLPVIIVIVNQLHISNPIIVILTALLGIGMIFQSLTIVDMWFQARVESKHSVVTRNISFLFTSALKIGAILMSGSIFVFGLIYLLDVIIGVILLVWIYRHHHHNASWELNWTLGRQLIRESAPLIVAGLAVTVYMRIDQVMLGQLLPTEEADTAVGLYAVAVKLSEMWYFVPAALISSVFPALVESKKQSQSLYRKRLQRLFNLVVLVSYAFAIPMTLLSGIIINVLFGSDYAEAGPILAVLVWSGLWVTLGLVRSQVLIAENAVKYSMWSTLLGAVANVILNLLFIPSLGAFGCAIATLISYGISAYLTSFFFNLSIPIGKMQTSSLLIPNPFSRK